MEPSLSEAKTPVSRLCLCSAPLARKRETQKFCLTPRLSLQLYYIPVLAPALTSTNEYCKEQTPIHIWEWTCWT